MAAEKNSEGSGLVWQPFPDTNNPVHQEIWKAYLKTEKVGSAYGAICNYYGVYLVTVSSGGLVEDRTSFFYDPKNHNVIVYNDGNALAFYKGNRQATPTNAVRLVQQLAAADGYKSFVVIKPNDIPHTGFSEDNPKLSFEEFLASKSIIIIPPTLMRVNGDDNLNGYGGACFVRS